MGGSGQTTGGEGRTVLVVDDDEGLRMLCRINLELEGYRVLEAATVESAGEQLGEGRIDAVLLDVHLGAGDGTSLLEAIRRDQPTARIALFTGSADIDPAVRAEVDDVIAKPFSLDELSATVGRLVASRA
jgi:DNA-binding NtrC family response regulator